VLEGIWSVSRPAPKASALPNCATPRRLYIIDVDWLRDSHRALRLVWACLNSVLLLSLRGPLSPVCHPPFPGPGDKSIDWTLAAMKFQLIPTRKAFGLFFLISTAVTASNLFTDFVDRRYERYEVRVQETCLLLEKAYEDIPDAMPATSLLLCSEYMD